MSKAPNGAERAHMLRVSELPCCVCQDYPVSVHHAKTGAGGRKNHMVVLPLCYLHHQGKEGIHTLGRKKWQALYGSEDHHLLMVHRELYGVGE